MSNEQRQVIVSNELDFFEDFEKTHGATLESETVTYGNEWDLYSASMSETSARAKRAVEKLRSAELLAALVSLKYPAFMKNHTRGARPGVQRPRALLGAQLDGRRPDLASAARGLAGAGGHRRSSTT